MTTERLEELAVKVLKLSKWDGVFPINPQKLTENIQIRKTLAGDESPSILKVKMQGEALGRLSGSAELIEDEDNSYFLCKFNKYEPDYRSRFTQAHELGHVVLGHVDRNCTLLRDEDFNQFSPQEIQANSFAAALIMPSSEVEKMLDKTSNVSQLATHFGVSPTALKYRLKNLNLA